MKKPIFDKWYMDKGIRVFEKQYPNDLFYKAVIDKYVDRYEIEISLCKKHKDNYKYLIDGSLTCNSLLNAKMIHESVIHSLTYLWKLIK